MPNPRAVVDFTGIDQRRETFDIDGVTITYDKTKVGGSAGAGLAVKMADDSKVALVGDGDIVKGKLDHVEPDGKCVVITKGFVDLPAGDGATVTPGSGIKGDLGAAGALGFIQNDSNGDTARGEIIDTTDTTKVVVEF